MNSANFINSIKKNNVHNKIFERLPELEIPDLWLVAGSLFQSVIPEKKRLSR